jgi:hypothetical protein
VTPGAASVTIGSDTYDVDRDEEFDTSDLDKAMDQVAAQISWYSQLWGEASAEQESADAKYRSWRARRGKELMDAGGEKLPEWKIKQEIEADPTFMKYKEAIARCMRNTTFLQGHVAALKEHSQTLRSKGAFKRAELEATGMATRGRSREDEAVRSATRRSDVKAALAKGKAKPEPEPDDDDDD